MNKIVETAFQYGTCARCGKDVERDDPGHRWHDHYGRDRCRADWEDGQCDVPEIHQGMRLSKLVETELTTVTLIGTDGQILLQQEIPQGMGYWEDLAEPAVISRFEVRRRKTHYRAALTPEEEMEHLAAGTTPGGTAVP